MMGLGRNAKCIWAVLAKNSIKNSKYSSFLCELCDLCVRQSVQSCVMLINICVNLCNSWERFFCLYKATYWGAHYYPGRCPGLTSLTPTGYFSQIQEWLEITTCNSRGRQRLLMELGRSFQIYLRKFLRIASQGISEHSSSCKIVCHRVDKNFCWFCVVL